MAKSLLSALDTTITMKSLVVTGGVISCACICIRSRERIAAWVGIGPYPSLNWSYLPRAVQRLVVDVTRRDVRGNRGFYPLLSQITANPVRLADNGHPKCGAVRDAARQLIVSALDAHGMTKYEISPAEITANDGRMAHQHYAVGDLHHAAREDAVGESDTIVCIDTDYYIKDVDRYFGHPQPVVMHTFNPVTVAGIDGDAPFRIINNEVVYDVGGGGQWRHRVYDWCGYGEFLQFRTPCKTIMQWLLSWAGIVKVTYQKVAYGRPWVDCPNRALVWLLPQYTAYQVVWLPCDLRARKLRYVEYADKRKPGWNSLVSYGEDGLTINLGREGEDATVTLPKVDYDVLMGLESSQSVTSRMLGMKHSDPRCLALVGQYYRGNVGGANDAHRLGRPAQAKVHWPATMEAERPETSARVYTNPILSTENMVPMIKRWEVLSNSIERRITHFVNNRVPPRQFATYAHEFTKLVVPYPKTGMPLTLEQARDELTKPSQVLAAKQIWETVDMEHRHLIEAFIKNEPTGKSGRIISSFADFRFLIKLSRYTLAFKREVLKQEHNQHWFVPGSTPSEVAQKVVDYVSSVPDVIEGDYTNMDGTVSRWLQEHVGSATILRWCNVEESEELRSLLAMLVTCPARAKSFGFRYEAGPGVKSGSPTTTDMNTIYNAYFMYCAVRRTQPDLTPAEAFANIGLCFGDDGLFTSLYKNALVRVVESCGMKIKVEAPKPENGVCFLARVYPDPLRTTTSFQDPIRTWRKLHITMRDPNVPLGSAAMDRLEGYLTTDRLSPLTASYCRNVIRLYDNNEAETAEKRRSRKTATREVPYWLTEGGAWPQAEEDVELMYSVTASRTGFSREDILDFERKMAELQDVWQVPTLNENDEPYAWKDTLDPSGQPVDACVDQRSFMKDRHVQSVRADRGVARDTRARVDQRAGTPFRSSSPDSGTEPGPGELPSRVGSDADEGDSPHGRGAVKARTRSIPKDDARQEALTPHEHRCFACRCVYSHVHRGGGSKHRQRAKQCPNPSCKEYTDPATNPDLLAKLIRLADAPTRSAGNSSRSKKDPPRKKRGERKARPNANKA